MRNPLVFLSRNPANAGDGLDVDKGLGHFQFRTFNAIFHEGEQVSSAGNRTRLSVIRLETGDRLPGILRIYIFKIRELERASIPPSCSRADCRIDGGILSGVMGRSLNQMPMASYRAFLIAAGVGAFVFSPAPFAE